jgi:outer membrane receptor for ferrienterochelin and colicins
LAPRLSGGAITANFNHNQHDTVDGDGNKVSEYTGYKRNLGGVGFFVDDIAGFKLKGRFDSVDEKRMGGAMGLITAASRPMAAAIRSTGARVSTARRAARVDRSLDRSDRSLQRRPGWHVGNHFHRPPAVRFQRHRKLGEGSLRFSLAMPGTSRTRSMRKPSTRRIKPSTTSRPARSSQLARHCSPEV